MRVSRHLLISSNPPNQILKQNLLDEHNRLRRLVPASNMRLMYWSDELAFSAQRHADRCDFRHSQDRINVGENIWASPFANYSTAVARWFNEVYDPRCNCQHAYKHCCGHYVQVVWSESNLVGCGFAHCHDIWGVLGRGHRYILVCHYNPQGNTVFVTRQGLFALPAFKWASDSKSRCGDCSADAAYCNDGLCSQRPKQLGFTKNNNNNSLDDIDFMKFH